MAKVIRDAVEYKINRKLKVGAVIMQWLIRWSAMLLSRCQVGKDGKTGYERRRGRACTTPLASFGESVWYRLMDKNKGRNKFDVKWEEGVWLGHARDTNEMLIGTPTGVVRTYACKRKPEAERWSADAVDAIQGTPSKPNPKKAGLYIPIRVPLERPADEPAEPEHANVRPYQPRRAVITQRELDLYGYTPGCIGCEARRQGAVAKSGHNQAC